MICSGCAIVQRDRTPTEKGRVLEDLVEYYIRLKGYKYERNARVRGLSGALHEIDFLVEDREGPILLEVKNREDPLPKEDVIKAFEVSRDIGARAAVVVSASGFTEGAKRVARALGVELLDLNDLLNYIEIAKSTGSFDFLEIAIDSAKALSYARRLVRKRLLVFPIEQPVGSLCIYYPVYFMETSFVVTDSTIRYRDSAVAVSAYTGLPLSLEGKRLIESCSKSSNLPPDLMPIYRALAGQRVRRKDFVMRYGEHKWRRMVSVLEALDLGYRLRVGGQIYLYIINDVPGRDNVENAADILLARRASAPLKECSVVRPRYSPGSARILVESLLEAKVRSIRNIYIPLYKIKLVSRDKSYRFVYITAWTPEPLEYAPVEEIESVKSEGGSHPL